MTRIQAIACVVLLALPFISGPIVIQGTASSFYTFTDDFNRAVESLDASANWVEHTISPSDIEVCSAVGSGACSGSGIVARTFTSSQARSPMARHTNDFGTDADMCACTDVADTTGSGAITALSSCVCHQR